MSEVNKAVIRRMIEEGVNKHNLSVIAELYPNCNYRSPAFGELKGEAFVQFFRSVLAAFPDVHITVLDQFGEDDKVVTRYRMTATHRGTFMDITATGKQVDFTGMLIDRVINGKIVEEWEEWDTLGMMQQLGVVPTVKLEAKVAA
jgi:predicted ester cyclase